MHRVEVAAPLLDETLREHAVELVQLCLSDNTKARIGQPDGTFVHCVPAEGNDAVNAQETQYQRAVKAAEK
jgi:polyphosphate kinase